MLWHRTWCECAVAISILSSAQRWEPQVDVARHLRAIAVTQVPLYVADPYYCEQVTHGPVILASQAATR